tara:strand:- start:1496 stop:1612 length:117 start_codon:yes stop_codon:yes gene_type:complete
MDNRPPTEAEVLFMMITIIIVATLLLNGIVYMFTGGLR